MVIEVRRVRACHSLVPCEDQSTAQVELVERINKG